MFQKTVRTISGVYNNPGFSGEEANYVYSTDKSMSVVTQHPVPSSGTTYYYRYVVTKTGTTTPTQIYFGRAVGNGGGKFLLAQSSTDSTDGPWINPFDESTSSSDFTLQLELDVSVGSEDQAGNYFITEQTWNDGDDMPDPATVTTFDLRILALKNLKADFYQVNTNSKNPTTTIKGDWCALPASTALYPSGWTPTSDITWNLKIALPIAVDVIKTFAPGTSAVSAPDANGKVGTLQQPWDCKSDGGQIQEGPRFFTCTGKASVPTIGSTTSAPKKNGVHVCHCKARSGALYADLTLDSVGNIALTLSYNGQFVNLTPGSMGYGWTANSNISVYEDPDTLDLSYQGEAGDALRWANESGSYVPYFADNFVTAVKDTDNPDYVYLITFPDQTQRQFGADGKILYEVDRNGNTNTYAYSSGFLASITDDTGRAVYFGYGSRTDGQLVTLRVNDSDTGRLTSFVYYDGSDPVSPNRLKSITNAAEETTTFVYDELGNILNVIDTRGNTAKTYTFDELGRKLTDQDYDQQLTTYTYPDDAQTITVTAQDLTGFSPTRTQTSYYDNQYNTIRVDENVDETTINTTLITYGDSQNPYSPTQVVDPNLATTTMAYNALGNLIRQTDAQGHIRSYDFAEDIDVPLNPKHRNLLRKIHRPSVNTQSGVVTYQATELQYDDNGNLVAAIDANNQTTGFTINSFGAVSTITDRRGNTTTFTYDSNRHLQTITTPSGPNDAPSRTTTFGYDDFDNMTSATDPLGHEVSYEFDGIDRPTQITDARGKYVTMDYLNGLLQSMEAPANAGSSSERRSTQYDYDVSNRLTAVFSNIAPSATQQRVGYTYNGFSNIKQLQRLMNGDTKSSSNQYDALGRLSSNSDFLGNTNSIAYAPFCVENTLTTARGVTMNSNYDTLCRLTQRETQDELQIFAYDELNRLISSTVGSRYGSTDALNSAYRQSAYAYQTQYQYDALDRPTRMDAGNGDVVTYEYDQESNVTSKVDQTGNTTLYSYYNDNRLYQVTFQSPGQVDQVFTYVYDAAGRMASITFPESTGMVASFTQIDGTTSGWNENGQLLCLRYLKDGAHFQRFEYSYDDSGNRIELIDTPTDLSNTLTWDYDYDWLNRLTTVSRNSVVSAQYGYDESDNRVSLSLPLSDYVYSYGYDLADRIQNRSLSVSGATATLVESYNWDQDGNMTSRTLAETEETTTYVWTCMNRLRQRQVAGVPQETNAYDAGGIRRLKKDAATGDSTKYFSSGAVSIADKTPTGNISFIQGGQLLGMLQNGNFYFYIADGLGSVRVLVDSDGDEAASASYNEFGMPENVSDSGGLMKHGYTGAQGVRNETAGSGLMYMRQRWYDPSIGSWLSQDPIGFSGGFNTTNYVGQNPIGKTDSSGLRDLTYDIKNKTGAYNPDYDAQSAGAGLGYGVVFGVAATGAMVTAGPAVETYTYWRFLGVLPAITLTIQTHLQDIQSLFMPEGHPSVNINFESAEAAAFISAEIAAARRFESVTWSAAVSNNGRSVCMSGISVKSLSNLQGKNPQAVKGLFNKEVAQLKQAVYKRIAQEYPEADTLVLRFMRDGTGSTVRPGPRPPINLDLNRYRQ